MPTQPLVFAGGLTLPDEFKMFESFFGSDISEVSTPSAPETVKAISTPSVEKEPTALMDVFKSWIDGNKDLQALISLWSKP